MNKRVAVAVIMTAVCGVAACDRTAPPAAAATEASPLEGVWRVAEVVVSGANPSSSVDPQSVYIFGKAHYSMMRVIGNAPRAAFKAVNPTNDEKIAAYDTFVGNAGTYEVAGPTLTVRPIVAKHPNFMGGGSDTYEFQRGGDTLWLTGKSTNIKFRVGTGTATDPAPPDETKLKLVRIL